MSKQWKSQSEGVRVIKFKERRAEEYEDVWVAYSEL